MDENARNYGPQYRALVEDLRVVARKKGRENAAAVMAKALRLQAEGKLSALDVAALQAVRMRVEANR
jgi:hypothetical protein